MNTDRDPQVAEHTFGFARAWAISPDLLGIVNGDGYFETSNPAWEALLGWSAEEVGRTALWDMLHPDDMERTRAEFGRLHKGETTIRVATRCRHQDGSYRWVSWIFIREDGLVYSTGRDITESKQQEAELAHGRADPDRVWRCSRDAITVIDVAGRIKAVNPAAEDVLGWSASDMIGHNILTFIHPEDRPPLTDDRLPLDRYARPRVILNRFRHKDGSYRYMSWMSATGEDGDIYSSGRDTTAERAQADALAAAQEGLRHAQKMEAVGQLTGGIAHDFNNLLTSIGGSLEMLRIRISQGELNSIDRYVTAAQEAAQRAAALTHRLLAFSRRQTLDPKSTDVNGLILGMADLVRRSVGPGVELELAQARGLWPTLVDPNQLENALLNLCLNARDAMPNGGRIALETANTSVAGPAAMELDLPPGEYITLGVTDTGTGMTPEVIARAFEPFYTTKPLGEGTGLGLSMVYGFVRQSGGQVRIRSAKDQGTTVSLFLPRDHAAPAPAAQDSARPDKDEEVSEVVLFVDDEPTIRMLVAEVVSELGYDGVEATDGASGLKILQSRTKIDLLVTDVGLPGGMNGRQLADAARAQRPDLKVLFITGYAANAVLGDGYLAPGMQVLLKPFALDVLARRIRGMVENVT